MAATAPVRLLDRAPAIEVPFFDWKALYEERSEDYLRIIHETASSGGFILQAAVEEFERKLAGYLGVRHAIGLSDCTNAMLLGLRASGVRPGDEIILPAHAFIAAAQAIHFAGGIPVPVDLEEGDGLIDPDAVRAAITRRTRGVMAVHVNGRVCAMDALRSIADEHGLEIYEDAAQGLGAKLDGQAAGVFGRWGAFSFYPSKTLGCFGDGGALVTNDDELAATVTAMRNHGAGPDKSIAPDCAVWGTNARLDNLQAAILAYKLGWYRATMRLSGPSLHSTSRRRPNPPSGTSTSSRITRSGARSATRSAPISPTAKSGQSSSGAARRSTAFKRSD
jgi:dTDP-4-amino-4,6-dideoxygalactose transaminase